MSALMSYAPLFPEMLLAIGALTLLMAGAFQPDTEAVGETIGWIAAFLLASAVMLVTGASVESETLFEGAYVTDAFARFMKVLILIGSAGALLMSFQFLRHAKMMKFELPVLVLLSTVGMMVMVSANDLISLYLGLELMSLALYVLAAFRRDDVRSSEAGLKYFVLGALSSGMLLYGASLIYGFTGSTSFPVIASVATSAAASNAGLIVGLVFVMVGLAFKVSAVPFHMWTPDVYEGAPTPITAFFAAAPKLAAMGLLIRVVAGAFPGFLQQWQQIIIVLSLASMLLGAFGAIGQTNIKRLMAYSSIGNIGFALVGLAAGTQAGVQAVLVYLAIYLAMTLGVFACILAMQRNSDPVEDIAGLSGLYAHDGKLAFAFSALMFSLAGIPPLAGFFGKFYVFQAAVNANLLWLAVAGVVASVVAAFYYIRIIKVIYFDEARAPFTHAGGGVWAVIAASMAVVVLFIASGTGLIDAALAAAKTFKL
ncbi:MAG: NADH-quinone oxidoreductase subunit NuoN [Hyphomicrobium sp.]